MPIRRKDIADLKGYKLARALRGARTLVWVCQKTGIDPAYLCRIENAKVPLGPKIALKLARLYRVNVNRLYQVGGAANAWPETYLDPKPQGD